MAAIDLFRVIKYRTCDGRRIKMVWCLCGEFVDEQTALTRRGFTAKTWKTAAGARRWLQARGAMVLYCNVECVA